MGYFLKGFGAGVGLVAFSTIAPMVTETAPFPVNLGAWVDIAVQALIAGLIIGAGADLYGRWRSRRG